MVEISAAKKKPAPNPTPEEEATVGGNTSASSSDTQSKKGSTAQEADQSQKRTYTLPKIDTDKAFFEFWKKMKKLKDEETGLTKIYFGDMIDKFNDSTEEIRKNYKLSEDQYLNFNPNKTHFLEELTIDGDVEQADQEKRIIYNYVTEETEFKIEIIQKEGNVECHNDEAFDADDEVAYLMISKAMAAGISPLVFTDCTEDQHIKFVRVAKALGAFYCDAEGNTYDPAGTMVETVDGTKVTIEKKEKSEVKKEEETPKPEKEKLKAAAVTDKEIEPATKDNKKKEKKKKKKTKKQAPETKDKKSEPAEEKQKSEEEKNNAITADSVAQELEARTENLSIPVEENEAPKIELENTIKAALREVVNNIRTADSALRDEGKRAEFQQHLNNFKEYVIDSENSNTSDIAQFAPIFAEAAGETETPAMDKVNRITFDDACANIGEYFAQIDDESAIIESVEDRLIELQDQDLNFNSQQLHVMTNFMMELNEDMADETIEKDEKYFENLLRVINFQEKEGYSNTNLSPRTTIHVLSSSDIQSNAKTITQPTIESEVSAYFENKADTTQKKKKGKAIIKEFVPAG